jgi:L-alanine-DL-glutamate epimerase-like enolase superfamily enzyme
VTVLATLGSGTDAATRPVLDAVEVVELTTSSGVAGRGEITVTVAVADPAVAVAGAHAARVGELTVVRLQGAVPAFGGTSTVELLGTGIAAGAATSEPLG